MNAFQGYGISILCFLFGGLVVPAQNVRINTPRPAVVALSPLPAGQLTEAPQNQVQSMVSPTDAAGREDVKIPPVSLPKVKNDHPGTRKEVPADPAKRCPQFEDDFRAYGLFPIETWSYIAWRESGCRIKAQNATWDANGNMTYHLNKDKSYDTGLLQINSSWKTVTKTVCGESAIENRMQGLKTLDCNLRVARYIMENSSGGLSNWRM